MSNNEIVVLQADPLNLPLTVDEIRAGMELTALRREAMQRVDACIEGEIKYIDALRAKYGLGPEWTVLDWLDGWQVQHVEGGGV